MGGRLWGLKGPVVIMVGGGHRQGGRAVVAADGVASGAADGTARSRRAESAVPNAEDSGAEAAGQRWYHRSEPQGRLRGDSPSSAHSRGRAGRGGEPDSSVWFRLVARDRWLLVLLAEHKVLTTNQIAAAAFGSVRRAQDRLRQLRALGVVFAFRDSYSGGGTSQTRYALGYLGARLIAAQRAVKPPTPQAYHQSLERLGLWPKLGHHLGVNQFFCDLASYARAHPQQVRGPEGAGGLTMWWSEKRCADFFWNTTTKVHPDGYGCWEAHGRSVRFFLEHDTGTEPLAKVTRKIDDYRSYPTNTFGVVLFSVHSAARETSLRAALRRDLAGGDPGFVIATAYRDPGLGAGPAGPIWALWSARGSEHVPGRYRLAELPQRGPYVVHHEPWPDQPFSQAAFDPLDPTILRLVETPTAPSAVLHPADAESITDHQPGTADFEDELTLYDEGDAEIDHLRALAPDQPEHRRRRWPTTWLG